MRRLTLAYALALTSCTVDPAADAGAVRRDAGPPPPRADDVDLLFVIDDAGSMAEKQASFAAALPGLTRALLTGDLDGDGTPDARPLDSLQIGVVTTDMGVGGHTVPTCGHGDFGRDGILQTRGRTELPGCRASYPAVLAFDPANSPEASGVELACVTNVGTSGCGLEQQLEAALKALTPARPTEWTADGYAPPRFFRDTPGHADGANDGLVRRDSLLGVVILSDEDDCALLDPDLMMLDHPRYGATDLNLRCFVHPEAVHPVARYVAGLAGLRRQPSRLLYAVLAGVPVDLEPSPDGPVDWDRLVGPEDVRDPRMVERLDPALPSRLVPSCNVPGRGIAFPPVRLVEVARDLEARGARVVVGSVCQDSYAAPMEAIARRILE